MSQHTYIMQDQVHNRVGVIMSWRPTRGDQRPALAARLATTLLNRAADGLLYLLNADQDKQARPAH